MEIDKLKIEDEDWDRFMRLRARLFKSIKECLEVDSCHKPSEGYLRIGLTLPDYFEDGQTDPEWYLYLVCSLIGPHRDAEWYGNSFHSLLKNAEKDIISWLDGHDEWLRKVKSGEIKFVE